MRGGRAAVVAAAVLPAAVALPACAGPHSALDPVSDAGAAIEWLWWVLFWVCLFVLLVVVAGYAYAILRRRAERLAGGAPEPVGRSLFWVLVAGALIPAAILTGLTAATIRTSARISAAERADALEVEVIGRQFWWEIRYPERGVVTANELHLPVDRPTRLRLKSADVIHSIWIPRLHGKLDLTPGRVSELVLHPREPGEYRGFCAEFCGAQHALMGLLVIAQPREEFEAWLEAQARPAGAPTDPLRAAGAAAFARYDCQLCHRVRGGGMGAPAADVGPDLTHFASRRTFAAATFPNLRPLVASWILDPHGLKPGVRMPGTVPSDEELIALVAYLEGLR